MNRKIDWSFLLCYGAYTSIYIARLNLSMASAGMRDLGLLNAAQIGFLGSVFSVAYAVGRLLNGTLGDRKPPYTMICLGLLFCGAANLAIGAFPPYIGILLLWGANAFAQSMLWSSVLAIIAAHYPPDVAKRKNAIMVTSVAVGNILGIVVNTALIEQFGLRWAFLVPGGLTLLFCGLLFFLIRGRDPIDLAPKAQKRQNLFRLLKNGTMRLTVLPAVMHGVMKDNISLWMAVFFIDRYGIDLKQSSYYLFLIPVVGLAGRLLYSLFYRLCGEYEHRVSVYGFIACALCSFALLVRGLPPICSMIALSVIYAAVSVVNTSFLSIYPVRFAEQGNVASVSGLMDFVTYLGAGIGSLIFGGLIGRFGYSAMFLIWGAISLLSVGLMLLLIRRDQQKA